MDFIKANKIVSSKQKGSFSSVTWDKVIPSIDGSSVVKRTNCVIRFGVEYDNMKSVVKKRGMGALPNSNQGLPWGKWKVPGMFIEHKQKIYLRCALAPNAQKHTTYYRNGVKVLESQLVDICKQKDLGGSRPQDVMNITLDNIVEIK